MVPVYAMQSWLALRFKDSSIYLQVTRVRGRRRGKRDRRGQERGHSPPSLHTHTHTHLIALVPTPTPQEAYEAYVLYSFYRLMLDFCGGKTRLSLKLRARAIKEGRDRARHLPPCSWCMRGWRLGSRFVHRNTIGCVLAPLVSRDRLPLPLNPINPPPSPSPQGLPVRAPAHHLHDHDPHRRGHAQLPRGVE
jgi:hypothetical protein